MKEQKFLFSTPYHVSLEVEEYIPEEKNGKSLIFFYGGGWMHDNRYRFRRFAMQLADCGYTVFLPEYRIYTRHKTLPADAVLDAAWGIHACASRIRELNLGIDQVFLGGASAGGHLALCCIQLERCRKIHNMSFCGLILFNPVIDPVRILMEYRKETGVEYDSHPINPMGEACFLESPVLILHGTEDELVPYEDEITFQNWYQRHNGICRIIPYEGRRHAFYLSEISEEDYMQSLKETRDFMNSFHNLKQLVLESGLPKSL